MRVDMEQLRDRDRQKNSSQFHGNDNKRSSDDVLSVGSWSEFCAGSGSLSLSSSAESGSRPGSLSSRQGSVSSLSKNSPARTKSLSQDMGFTSTRSPGSSARKSAHSVTSLRHSAESITAGATATTATAATATATAYGPAAAAGASNSVSDGRNRYSAPTKGSPRLSLSEDSDGHSGTGPQNANRHSAFRANSSDSKCTPLQTKQFESWRSSQQTDLQRQQQLMTTMAPTQNLYPILDVVANNVTDGDIPAFTNMGGTSLTNYNALPGGQQTGSGSRPRFFDPYIFKGSSGRQLKKQNQSRGCHQIPNTNSSSSYPPSTSRNQIDDGNVTRDTHHLMNQMEQTSLQGSAFRSQPSISNVNHDLSRLPKSSSNLDSMRGVEHRLEPDNVKTKLMSAWNNFKYGWTLKTKSSMKYDTPLYLLGRIYHKRREEDSQESTEEHEFLKHFCSRVWLTYRSNFYPIPGTRLSSDCGWGCMLRSGQMLVAQCLVTHFLGPDWRLHNQQTREEQAYHREIIRWFSEPVDGAPSDKTPFCLHNLANFGRQHKKEPGEWYGPASVAFIFRDAFEKASQSLPILSQLCLYVAQDCTVYVDDVLDLCTARSKSGSMGSSFDTGPDPDSSEEVAGAQCSSLHPRRDASWQRSLIILVPMRLGGEMLNDIYVPCVKKLLSQHNCMGVIGGKPKHSLYFLGYQEDKLIYLDPHYCRDAVDTRGNDFKIETYHCMSPRKLSFSKMDPSCTVGFYIKNEKEFQAFREIIQEVASPPQDRASYPMFIFSEGSHRDAHGGDLDSGSVDKGMVKVTHYRIDANGQKMRAFSKESEDFIVL
ncbi:cysteine protease atg4 [Aplysia californica]|uniref:Cysteine protease n=1 Tax=Aplysia californica TaxID=6500 RepID=A0ABM0K370_APLCA|nr:cysteine protease atg4 [Aplysia californica]